MDRDTAVGIVEKRIGRRSDLTDTIVDEMQVAQDSLELMPFNPFFMHKRVKVEVFAANGNILAVPSDFLLEEEGGGLTLLLESENVPLVKDDHDDLLNRFPGTDTYPCAYSLVGNSFTLFPEFTADLTLDMAYIGKDSVLDTNIENNWLLHAPHLLIAETAFIMASQHLQAARLAESFRAAADREMQKLMARSEAREGANRSYEMAEDS